VTIAAGRNGPDAIVADGTYVYWTDKGGGDVMRMLPDGGGASPIASGQGSPTSLAITGGNAYWTNATGGQVMRASLAGGSPVPVATGQASPGTIAVDGQEVFWTTTNGSNCGIQQWEPADGGVTQWLADTCPLTALAVVGSAIYWSDWDSVNAGSLVTWNTHPEVGSCQSPPCPLAFSSGSFSSNLVWADSASTTAVEAWTIGAPYNPWVVATGPSSQTRIAIAADSVNAYWANSDGTIMKAPVTPGTAVTLATGQGTPGGIALDSTSLYWTNSTAGTVMKLTPR
jgi:hypothetical protein